MIKHIILSLIRLDGDTQTRVTMNSEVVDEYADLMTQEGGSPLPPIQVVQEGDHYWLVDGFHRVAAAKKSGEDMITAEVFAGTVNDAQWMAIGANKNHGLRRTNADKAKAVQMALSKWPNQSNRQLAEHIGVHSSTVDKYRNEMAPKVPETGTSKPADATPETREGRDGKSYPVPPPSQPPATPPEPPRNGEPSSLPTATFYDEVQCEIPEDRLELWQSKSEAQELSKEIKRVRLFFENIDPKEKPLYSTFNLSHIIASLKNAQKSIDSEVPYAVCVFCGGDGCQACNDRGFLGKLKHDMAPEDMKATMGVE